MKIALLAALLTCVAVPSFAQQRLFGGRPQVVYELEHEKAADNSGHANSVTLYPGIRWKEGWINELEVMLKYEREAEDGTHRETNQNGGEDGHGCSPVSGTAQQQRGDDTAGEHGAHRDKGPQRQLGDSGNAVAGCAA